MILLQPQFCTYTNIRFMCSFKFSSAKCNTCMIYIFLLFAACLDLFGSPDLFSFIAYGCVACKFIPCPCHPPLYLHPFSSKKCMLIFSYLWVDYLKETVHDTFRFVWCCVCGFLVPFVVNYIYSRSVDFEEMLKDNHP